MPYIDVYIPPGQERHVGHKVDTDIVIRGAGAGISALVGSTHLQFNRNGADWGSTRPPQVHIEDVWIKTDEARTPFGLKIEYDGVPTCHWPMVTLRNVLIGGEHSSAHWYREGLIMNGVWHSSLSDVETRGRNISAGNILNSEGMQSGVVFEGCIDIDFRNPKSTWARNAIKAKGHNESIKHWGGALVACGYGVVSNAVAGKLPPLGIDVYGTHIAAWERCVHWNGTYQSTVNGLLAYNRGDDTNNDMVAVYANLGGDLQVHGVTYKDTRPVPNDFCVVMDGVTNARVSGLIAGDADIPYWLRPGPVGEPCRNIYVDGVKVS